MEARCMGCMQMKKNRPVCEHCGYDEQSHNQSNQLPAGTLVGGQYTLGRVLGQGGFGITYIGWDNVMNQRVAVKEYFPKGYAGRDIRTTTEVTSYDSLNDHSFADNKRRFLREAESLAKLWDVSRIVRVLRYFEENGTAYIAMEYVEGENLHNYMKRLGRTMTMEEIMSILGPIMEALTHVHKAELVHRDVSPDNIMVLPDGTSKLLDFGAARYVENADAKKDRNTSTQAILKHGFAPPEQYRSRGALGPWTDIYAMCATVYYCLTGQVPPESMSRMMREDDLDLDHLPGLTRKQKAALTNGMALIPKDRTKTAAELYSQLFSELIATRKAKKKAERERKRREIIKKILAPAAVLLLAAVIGILVMNLGDSPTIPAGQAQTTPSTEAALETAVENQPTQRDWTNNLMASPVFYEDAGIFDWWEQNQHRYAGMANTYSFSTPNNSVSMPNVAREDYLLSVPIFDTDIPRSEIVTVTFLDTLADAPEDAWDVRYRQNGTGPYISDNLVLAWVTPADGGLYHLYIAAEGGVNGSYATYSMFRFFVNLREIRFNGNFHIDTADTTAFMFYECRNLVSVDVNTLNTACVKNMQYMFANCSSLTELDVSGMDTGNVEDMFYMFAGCTNLPEEVKQMANK